jgi:hypothetical protein
MRRRVSLLVATGLALAGVALLACGGTSQNAPGHDAGVTSSADSGATIPVADAGVSPSGASDSGPVIVTPTCTSDPACSAPGPQCSGSTVVTCALQSNGCLIVSQTTPCAADQTCASSGVSVACVCNSVAPCTTTGAICQGISTVVVCTADANGCLTATSKTCGTNQSCDPELGACICNTSPCNAVGTSCESASELLTCTTDTNGCLVGVQTPCGDDAGPDAGTCIATATSASCQ